VAATEPREGPEEKVFSNPRGIATMAGRHKTVTLEALWEQISGFMESCMACGAVDSAGGNVKKNWTVIEMMDVYTNTNGYLCGNKNVMDKEQNLYLKLLAYLTAHCRELLIAGRVKNGEDLLNYYNKMYDRYMFSTKVLGNRMAYLDKYWIPRKKEAGIKTPNDITQCFGEELLVNKDIYLVKQAFMVVWRDTVLKEFQDKLFDAADSLIMQDRNGEKINARLVQGLTECFVALGIQNDDNASEERKLGIYRNHFEAQFLENTADYYTTEAEAFLSENTVTDYMIKAEDRLAQEMKRVDTYLHESTRAELKKNLEKVLIETHKARMIDDFERLLTLHEKSHLKRMYELLSVVRHGHTKMIEVLETHATAAGERAVDQAGKDADAKAYVECLLTVYKTYEGIITHSFAKDPKFIAALDRACRKFINKNAVTAVKKGNTTAYKTQKTPELLAKYCDSLLRKSKITNEELEVRLDDLMIVFRYLEDNDVFQKFYMKTLSSRLIKGNSVSDDAEANMISKLKATCGVEWTRKLEGMYKDIHTSKELTDRFAKKSGSQTPIKACSYLVLCKGTWPLRFGHELTLPAEMAQACRMFSDYYATEHTQRQLTWLADQSRGEIKTHFLNPDKSKKNKSYMLQASAHQMAILMQFNKPGDVTMEEILARTDSVNDKEYMGHVMDTLLKTKLVKKKEEGVFTLNRGWKNAKVKVNINMPVKAAKEKEDAAIDGQIQDERKYVMQACIVRTMKTRKTSIRHTDLVQAVIEQTKTRFIPTVRDINKQIGVLIDKEYMQRHEGKRDVYDYLA